MALVAEFIKRVIEIHKTGIAREQAYRPALDALLQGLGDELTPVNDPARSAVGAPDYIILKGGIAIGHLEAKDVDVSIDVTKMSGANKDQHARYVGGLPNLIYTNCLDWEFYRDGRSLATVKIAALASGKIKPISDAYAQLEGLLKDFVKQTPQTITSPKDLATRMAGKAVLIKDVLFKALLADKENSTELSDQYRAFKQHLIHDISEQEFTDIYAETIAYGMFAARLHDKTEDNFGRIEALQLLPKSNPFLRNLFSFVAGVNLDDRIAWIIDDLAAVLQASNVKSIMKGFGKLTGRADPFLHFYETFLAAYNPQKRKARGVWYTPEPVVNFIVRAVDEVLATEFGLTDGLADTSKITVDWDTGQTDKRGKPISIKKEFHKVQILDPATGTGTFLAEVIKQIAPKVKGVAPSMWSSYIEKELVPRLHGFELLMASYAMCHMKLDMILTELGYKPTGTPPRLSVYLTNSLEEGEPANQTLPFAQWLSNEVKQANAIKRDVPIMCVIGNPPYSGISHNMGEWIKSLIEDYKYVDGVHFGERKHWMQDDYVKFVRLSEALIEKNGEGVLGFITNHGYLENPTFRGMRWHLLKTFDRIYILDLHGNTNKREVTPDGAPDRNVFDIRQGVAIIVAVKTATKNKTELAEVRHGDLWGSRAEKYEALNDGRITTVTAPIQCTAPLYVFARRDNERAAMYDKGFSVADFFVAKSVAIVTANDYVNVSFTMTETTEKLQKLRTLSEPEARKFFKLKEKDARDWTWATAKNDADSPGTVQKITYRPFDERFTYYTGNSRGLYASPQRRIMRQMMRPNTGLCFNRTVEEKRPFTDAFVFSGLIQHHSLSLKEVNYLAPLYLYPEHDDLHQDRVINFRSDLFHHLRERADHEIHGLPDEVEVFDYIYGVLYCPDYRRTYEVFLRSGYPRIPWPANPDEFWNVSTRGTALRKLHLMEANSVGDAPYPLLGEGDNTVGSPKFKDGKIWINKTQWLDNVPSVSWDFFIGGYQPARKWLKDRKGRALSFEDVKHYQRILKILAETDRIMETIEIKI